MSLFADPDTVEHYIRQYMAEDWESISVLGEYSRGLEAVLELVNITLTAFPDLKLHILDSFCEGEDQMFDIHRYRVSHK